MDKIVLKNVSKVFGDFTAVNNLSMNIPSDKIFGLLGSNGAGKTTTINMLSGILIPDKGSIKVSGLDIKKDIEEIRKNLGLVPQTISLYESLTIYENLEFFGSLYIDDEKKLEYQLDRMLDIFKLREKKDVRIENLSGGYKRRCSIGCALISKPKVLILDEPLTGIDLHTTRIIMDFIKSIKGVTVIFTTHSIKEAETVCDYIVFMDKGQKVLEGTPNDIKKKYSKILGENIILEFDQKIDFTKLTKHLKKTHTNIIDLMYDEKKNVVTFKSLDLGKSVIEILESIDYVKKKVSNIDIRKPSLEDVVKYVMEGLDLK